MSGDEAVAEVEMSASGRPVRKAATKSLISFTEDEADEAEVMPPPKARKAVSAKSKDRVLELELEKERLLLEREKVSLEQKRADIELERLRLASVPSNSREKQDANGIPCKLKIEKYNHASGEDILTYLQDFEAIATQLKWSDEIKVLQLRTLLTEEAKEIAQQACKNYQDLKCALIERFGKRPYEYFLMLLDIKKRQARDIQRVESKNRPVH